MSAPLDPFEPNTQTRWTFVQVLALQHALASKNYFIKIMQSITRGISIPYLSEDPLRRCYTDDEIPRGVMCSANLDAASRHTVLTPQPPSQKAHYW